MMTSGAKLTNEQSVHLEFINRFRCEAQHEHVQDWNITQKGRQTSSKYGSILSLFGELSPPPGVKYYTWTLLEKCQCAV